ncbi:FIG00458480: hypothetical protein [Caballeronia glathei]|jgi:hypothetical protein|uniref:Uncharacterized protein n=2 Tax=Caballeronia glathei TaxID=60547 RepID=A0A069PMG0_9BURK|nr:hypothetical protein [Caballeronia glathei]KDR41883.1 hypothetical protein BG61_14270 [Caballeronia glathei]TCK36602.1 hypothetical protein B0G84_5613 [Paraburkholderia sp. BL8N3]CDY77067.1 FIG00458480: hypothetical protein [Caballeronia glathei]
MNTPSTKPPTKKAFHFPKSGEKPLPAADAPAAKARKPAVKTKPAKEIKAAVKTGAASKKTSSAKSEAKEVAVKVPEPATNGSTEKQRRVKKEKVVRDSFTMPKSDYEKIAALKKRCLAAGVTAKKSELLRAALQLLAGASEKQLVAAVSALEQVKTGRPAKS